MKKSIKLFLVIVITSTFNKDLAAQCTCGANNSGRVIVYRNNGGYQPQISNPYNYTVPVVYNQPIYNSGNNTGYQEYPQQYANYQQPYLNNGYPYIYNDSYQQANYNGNYQPYYNNQQPQRRTFGQKVSRIVQIVNAFGQIVGAVETITTPQSYYSY